jgi:hypothetical protein
MQDDVKASIGDQIVCSAVTGQECSTDKEINKGAWYLQALTLSGQGVIIFCCLGMSKVLDPPLIYSTDIQHRGTLIINTTHTTHIKTTHDTQSGYVHVLAETAA